MGFSFHQLELPFVFSLWDNIKLRFRRVGAGGRAVGGPSPRCGADCCSAWTLGTRWYQPSCPLPRAHFSCEHLRVSACVLPSAILQWRKRYAGNRNKLSYFDPSNKAFLTQCYIPETKKRKSESLGLLGRVLGLFFNQKLQELKYEIETEYYSWAQFSPSGLCIWASVIQFLT